MLLIVANAKYGKRNWFAKRICDLSMRRGPKELAARKACVALWTKMALCCGQTTAGMEGTRAATAHARLHAGKRDTKAASSVGQAEPASTRGTSPTKQTRTCP